MDDAAIRAALARRLYQRSVANGSITLPAVPGLLDEYVNMCDRVFMGIGVRFTDEQLLELRGILAGQLREAFAATPRSNIVITYDSPTGSTVNYHVKGEWSSIDFAYENWIGTREPPFFGTRPDARVMALVQDTVDSPDGPILDLGAGTGRNTLALARIGYHVDAVEVTAGFAETLRGEAEREKLPVRVIERDIFAAADELRRDYRVIVLSEVTSDFRSVDQLRAVFELAAGHLRPDGHFIVNVFIARESYLPDASAQELGQQCYSMMFTRDELSDASSDLPLVLVADDSVLDYEQAHQPPDEWPPTPWFERWARGQDLFDVAPDQSPIELRWLVYGKVP